MKIEFDDDDMASYDDKDAKAWVLEKGDYTISIQSDSHHVIDSEKINVADTVTYDSESNTHNGDRTMATNQFDYAAGDVTYLSRANHFANYAEATAAPTNFSMSDEVKAAFTNNGNYDPTKIHDDSDEMPTTRCQESPTVWPTCTARITTTLIGEKASRPVDLRRCGQPHRQWWLRHSGRLLRRQDPAHRR